MGNMAAPLGTASCWVTDASGDRNVDDVEDERGVESANPFSFGLLHTIVEEDTEANAEFSQRGAYLA